MRRMNYAYGKGNLFEGLVATRKNIRFVDKQITPSIQSLRHGYYANRYNVSITLVDARDINELA